MEQTKYDVFISYSRKDYVDDKENVIPGNEVSKIREALTEAGITYWFDVEGIIPGEDYGEKIIKYIKAAKILVYLSSQSANNSDWTRKEIASAQMYKKNIIPLLLDDSPFSDSVMFRIVDLHLIKYYVNPQAGLEELIQTIKKYLKKEREAEALKEENEHRRQEELERQRQEQEEERKRQERIEKIETEIAALESQRTEHKKTVLQREKDLELAQFYLDDCEKKILKQQKKLDDLRSPEKERKAKDAKIIDGNEKKEESPKTKQDTREESSSVRDVSVGDISFKMIEVGGGTFQIGLPTQSHWVTLKGFYIGEVQVTQALWVAVMKKNPSRFKGDTRPVDNVSWDDCQDFIKKLNNYTKMQFCLPTEAQWEVAAKGGEKSKGYKNAGSNAIKEVAWYKENSKDITHPVKEKRANEIGLYDMCGNVWEWCQDSAVSEDNSSRKAESTSHVLRGGSCYTDSKSCCLTSRFIFSSDSRSSSLGFRLVLNKKD